MQPYLTDDQRLRRNLAAASLDWHKTHRRHTMITLDEYVGIHANSPDWTPQRASNAILLLDTCDRLRTCMEADGVVFPVNPKTGTCVSGELHGWGGFRTQDAVDQRTGLPEGAKHSNHKEGLAVDNYDPDNAIDNYLMAHQSLLDDYSIYIEHPDTTPGWSHWSTKSPGSGHHVFYP